MIRNKTSGLIYVIIGLAVIGLFSQLFTNTAAFLKSIFLMIGIGLVLFVAIYFIFLRNRNGSSDMSKYRKAVKQSKLKYKQAQNKNSHSSITKKRKQPIPMKKLKNTRTSHLRVIEGNKGNKSKRKNRASF